MPTDWEPAIRFAYPYRFSPSAFGSDFLVICRLKTRPAGNCIAIKYATTASDVNCLTSAATGNDDTNGSSAA